jgi:hypothetical protein
MKKMLDWLMYLLWGSEIVFLAASTPHIATYFEHFDNPTDLASSIYAWVVGYGLAFTIDGVTFVVLMSLVVAIKYRRPWWLTAFLILSLLLISSLSWFINWQYDIVFGSISFARADNVEIIGTTVGRLNPLIGGAFPLLSVLYALVAKALEVDESQLTKAALTPEQFENEKRRLKQEQELKAMKQAGWNGKGLLTSAKERLVGVQSLDSETLVSPSEEDNDTPRADDPIDNVVLSDSLGSTRNVPLNRACELLECDVRTVKQLLSKGKIKSPGTSEKLVTRSSIDAYLTTRRKRKGQSQESQPTVARESLASDPVEGSQQNGHSYDTDPLGFPVLNVLERS